MVTLATLYNDFKTLIKQNFYDKDETDGLLSAKVDMIMAHHDTNSDKVTDAINELMGRKAETSELLSLMKSQVEQHHQC